METGPLRWASSEGVFLFQVPYEEKFFPLESIILLSSSLNAIDIFLDKEQITFKGQPLSIVRLNFHPPFSTSEDTTPRSYGYVIHSYFKTGFCFQSLFYADEITNELSEFETAFLESVVNHVLETLKKQGRYISDIPFLQDKFIISDVEEMLHDIDTKYKTLAASWALSAGPDCSESRFDFSDVYYNGKIRVEDLFYDLADRAVEALDEMNFTQDEKITLFKIAKSLVSLSGLLYSDDSDEQFRDDQLNFAHSEIILQGVRSSKLYRLDVRSYELDKEQFCDITIMG